MPVFSEKEEEKKNHFSYAAFYLCLQKHYRTQEKKNGFFLEAYRRVNKNMYLKNKIKIRL